MPPAPHTPSAQRLTHAFFSQDSRETRKFGRQLVQAMRNVGDGMSSLNNLFAEYVLRKDRELHPSPGTSAGAGIQF